MKKLPLICCKGLGEEKLKRKKSLNSSHPNHSREKRLNAELSALSVDLILICLPRTVRPEAVEGFIQSF
jgi:hypothetical protein